MVKYLFLDIDGVLNSSEDDFTHNISDEKINLLKQIVEKTNCRVILSSSWRNMPQLKMAFCRQLAQHGIEVFSQTPYLPEKSRVDEIRTFLSNNLRPENCPYAVIDDDNLDIDNFIRTDYNHGIQQSHVDKIIEILNT